MTVKEAVRVIREFDRLYEETVTELSDIERLLDAANAMANAYEELREADQYKVWGEL